jgi:hypothetical protein
MRPKATCLDPAILDRDVRFAVKNVIIPLAAFAAEDFHIVSFFPWHINDLTAPTMLGSSGSGFSYDERLPERRTAGLVPFGTADSSLGDH